MSSRLRWRAAAAAIIAAALIAGGVLLASGGSNHGGAHKLGVIRFKLVTGPVTQTVYTHPGHAPRLRAKVVFVGTLSGPIVLGSKYPGSLVQRGWGTVRPSLIDNGGDPTGLVERIHWESWGGSATIGFGVTSIYASVGVYPRLQRGELRAFDIGRCAGRGPLAYRRLAVRVPLRPDGRLGGWQPWGGGRGDICKDGG